MARRKLEDTLQVGLRLPVELVQRADAYAAALTAEHPGMGYSRTDAIRIALTRSLPPLPTAEQGPAELATVTTKPPSSKPSSVKAAPTKKGATKR